MEVEMITVCIVVGALAGWVASMTKGRNGQIGVIANIVMGIIGAFIGALLWETLATNGYGVFTTTGFSLNILLGAIAGAIIVLFIVRLVWPQSGRNPARPDQDSQPLVLPKASPKKVPTGNIFLSYRRSDSQAIAGRIYDRLVPAFGKISVFKDVDAIPPGADFREVLTEQVSGCSVLLAVIGDTWLTAGDGKGKRRLEDARDFVRIEIESALERDIHVIPLLVNGASMPSEEELPAGLKQLAFRNAIDIRHDPDFHNDMNRLITALKAYVKPKR